MALTDHVSSYSNRIVKYCPLLFKIVLFKLIIENLYERSIDVSSVNGGDKVI